MTAMLAGLTMCLPGFVPGAIEFSARSGSAPEGNPWTILLQHVLAAAVFALLGIVVFAISIWLFVKLCPFSVRKEIEEDQNTALAVIMGSVLLGISIIIAAAIFG